MKLGWLMVSLSLVCAGPLSACGPRSTTAPNVSGEQYSAVALNPFSQDLIPAQPGACRSYRATGINASGQIVGDLTDDKSKRVFVSGENGKDLRVLIDVQPTSVERISDSGQFLALTLAAGLLVLFTHGVPTSVDVGSTPLDPVDINSSGQFVGTFAAR